MDSEASSEAVNLLVDELHEKWGWLDFFALAVKSQRDFNLFVSPEPGDSGLRWLIEPNVMSRGRPVMAKNHKDIFFFVAWTTAAQEIKAQPATVAGTPGPANRDVAWLEWARGRSATRLPIVDNSGLADMDPSPGLWYLANRFKQSDVFEVNNHISACMDTVLEFRRRGGMIALGLYHESGISRQRRSDIVESTDHRDAYLAGDTAVPEEWVYDYRIGWPIPDDRLIPGRFAWATTSPGRVHLWGPALSNFGPDRWGGTAFVFWLL